MIADARLVIPAVSGAVIVGVLLGIPELLAVVAIGGWVSAGVVIAVAILVPRARNVCATLAVTVTAVAMLLTSATALTAERTPEILVEAAQSNRFVTMIAVTDSEVLAGAPSPRTSVTITDVTVGPSSVHSVAIPALVFGSIPPSGIGTRISLSGTLAGTQAGDRTAYLVFAKGSVRIIAEPPWFLSWSNELRAHFRVAATGLPGEGGALLPGLAIGDTRAVSVTLDQAMKATSLSHLTAVSGDTVVKGGGFTLVDVTMILLEQILGCLRNCLSDVRREMRLQRSKQNSVRVTFREHGSILARSRWRMVPSLVCDRQANLEACPRS